MRFGGCFSTLCFSSFAGSFESIHVHSFWAGHALELLVSLAYSEGPLTTAYWLRCRECGKTYGHQPLSICDECFSPLEVTYDFEYARTRFTRETISQGPLDMWRYRRAAAGCGQLRSADAIGFDAAGEGSAAGRSSLARTISMSRTTPYACLR